MTDRITLAVPRERIERSILLIRGRRVMLDADLADLYGVTTRRLNEQVRRNIARFPEDFMFQLTREESERLRCQFGTSNLRSQFATSGSAHGGRRYAPLAFNCSPGRVGSSSTNPPACG